MSLNVLVIPEDFRKDQYVLRPLLRRMFEEIGKPRARVEICIDPLLGGVDQALKWERVAEVISMYPMVQIFLLIVDRDGKPGRRQALDALEQSAAELLGTSRILFGENAWQEIEVWALAGQDLPADWKWSEIRGEDIPRKRISSLIPRAGNLRTSLVRGARRWGARQLRTISACAPAAPRMSPLLKTDCGSGVRRIEVVSAELAPYLQFF